MIDELHFFLNNNERRNFQVNVKNGQVTMGFKSMYANLTATWNDDDDNDDDSDDNDGTGDGSISDSRRHHTTAAIDITLETYQPKFQFLSWYISFVGDKGTITYDNSIFPFWYHSITVTANTTTTTTTTSNDQSGTTSERVEYQYNTPNVSDSSSSTTTSKRKMITTFEYQLEEFARVVKHGELHGYPSDTHNLLRNVQLAEEIVRNSGQEPFTSW